MTIRGVTQVTEAWPSACYRGLAAGTEPPTVPYDGLGKASQIGVTE
jgi:hypothetical protein